MWLSIQDDRSSVSLWVFDVHKARSCGTCQTHTFQKATLYGYVFQLTQDCKKPLQLTPGRPPLFACSCHLDDDDSYSTTHLSHTIQSNMCLSFQHITELHCLEIYATKPSALIFPPTQPSLTCNVPAPVSSFMFFLVLYNNIFLYQMPVLG